MPYMNATPSLAPAVSYRLWPAMDWPVEMWMALFDQMPTPIIVFRAEGQLILANKEASAQLGLVGLEGLEGQKTPDFFYPLMKAAQNLSGQAPGRVAYVTAPQGTQIPFLVKRLHGYLTNGVLAAFGLEKISPPFVAAKASETLDDSAVMADAVSQKVKGPLAGIELCASILGEELSESGEINLTDLIEEIRFSVREVNEYLTSFESMTKPLSLELNPVNMADVVDEALSALKDVFKANGIGVLVDQKDVVVEADRGLLVQLFLNLFLNAAEAMTRGGRIHVEFRLNRKGQAEVIVTDTGPGIALRDMKKIFNPFFTTKNQPLGLGLPVCLRIVEAHQGSLVVGTNGDYGGRALVALPCIPAQASFGPPRSLN
ncbi:MAG: PAS domain-containing sensor histidine kinase [Deltaproteobacteria bacterium]|jgi:signal transduction histidine kinase|nr:PAS domain-containing sensor histidine kinase [Deltaproteobacteria bacterium]